MPHLQQISPHWLTTSHLLLDLTEELGDHFGVNDEPASEPGPGDIEAPLKRGRRKKISLPLYDMLKFEREGKF